MVRTPNFEKLAEGGMRFATFYAPSPRCTPSRAGLFTGKSPAQLHMTFVGEGRRDSSAAANRKLIPPRAAPELPTSETTIAALLRQAGYATAHFGKWHVGRIDPARYGFDAGDGTLTNKRFLIPVGADGMKLDEQGNLYLAEKGILVYTVPRASSWRRLRCRTSRPTSALPGPTAGRCSSRPGRSGRRAEPASERRPRVPPDCALMRSRFRPSMDRDFAAAVAANLASFLLGLGGSGKCR